MGSIRGISLLVILVICFFRINNAQSNSKLNENDKEIKLEPKNDNKIVVKVILNGTWHSHNRSEKRIPPRYEEPRHHKKACHKKKPCGKPKCRICVVKPCQPRISCRPITTKTTTTTTTTTTPSTTTTTITTTTTSTTKTRKTTTPPRPPKTPCTPKP
jgi:hypothetical protein